jgi:hypothetical protein
MPPQIFLISLISFGFLRQGLICHPGQTFGWWSFFLEGGDTSLVFWFTPSSWLMVLRIFHIPFACIIWRNVYLGLFLIFNWVAIIRCFCHWASMPHTLDFLLKQQPYVLLMQLVPHMKAVPMPWSAWWDFMTFLLQFEAGEGKED